jgi:hypothetical protein
VIGRIAQQVLGHRRLDDAGVNRIDTDIEGGEIGREGLAE